MRAFQPTDSVEKRSVSTMAKDFDLRKEYEAIKSDPAFLARYNEWSDSRKSATSKAGKLKDFFKTVNDIGSMVGELGVTCVNCVAGVFGDCSSHALRVHRTDLSTRIFQS